MLSAWSLIGLVLAIWVVIDANRRDWRNNRFCNRAWKWIVGLLLAWPVTFVVYLFQRGRVPLKG